MCVAYGIKMESSCQANRDDFQDQQISKFSEDA